MKQNKHFVKAVTFDLWETLVFERDGYSSRRMTARCANLSEALKSFGLELTIEQLRVAIDEKVKPCETIHVGDNLKADIWGAKNAGWKTIFFQSQAGRDKEAEADHKSLVSLSRNLGNLKEEQAKPDKTVASLSTLSKVIQELETV